MNQKTTLVVLGVTLAIVASLALAPIAEEMAYAHSSRIVSKTGALIRFLIV